MSDFEQESLKILLDKGLLGIIAVAFGTYLGRLTERYRASHAYYTALAQKRIDAFQSLAEHLGSQVAAISRILSVLEEERRQPSVGGTFGQNLLSAYQEFRRSHEETKAPLARNTIFLTKEVLNDLTACQAKIDDFVTAFQDAPGRAVTPDQLVASGKDVTASLAALLSTMSEEIHRYRFT